MDELLALQCTVVATPGKCMLGNESGSWMSPALIHDHILFTGVPKGPPPSVYV